MLAQGRRHRPASAELAEYDRDLREISLTQSCHERDRHTDARYERSVENTEAYIARPRQVWMGHDVRPSHRERWWGAPRSMDIDVRPTSRRV